MIFQITTPRMELWRIDGPFANDLHMHEDDYQITVPMYGTCAFIQENRSYALADGDGLVQHPRERHVFEIGGQAGVVIFKLKEAGLREFARGDSLELKRRPQFDRARLAGQMRQWTEALMTFDPQDRLPQEEMELRVFRFLHGILSGGQRRAASAGYADGTDDADSMSGGASGASRSGRGIAKAGDAYMAQALNYIHAHYAQAIALDDLARIAMRSRFHFLRTFKAAFGISPYQYVLHLRIEEAKRLLGRTGRTVTDIGTDVGFSSGGAFSRAFAKAVGVPPEQFRKESLG